MYFLIDFVSKNDGFVTELCQNRFTFSCFFHNNPMDVCRLLTSILVMGNPAGDADRLATLI